MTLSEAGRADVPETDLADVPETELTRVISLTAEDAHVFGTTVRENLRVARPDAADAELAEALARAGLGDWLDSLPAGLDTLLGADGTDVSGGERRRLLLARALLVGADVLLLDEPTEHLDPEVADALLRDLLDAGPTVVVVTHRISGAAVDEICRRGQGTIAARGRMMS